MSTTFHTSLGFVSPAEQTPLSKAKTSFFSEIKRLFFGGTSMAKQVLSGFGLMNVRGRPGALYFITFITIHGMLMCI